MSATSQTVFQVFVIQPKEAIILSVFFLGIAICLDLRRHTIPNWLTLSACLTGLTYHVWVDGPAAGAMFSLQGLGVGFAMLLVPFLMGGMGGGDVKLLAAMGSWTGPAAVFNLFLYGALAGGGIAVIMVVGRSGFKGLRNMVLGLFLDLAARQKPRVDQKRGGLPYSIPMGIGYAAYLLAGRIV